MSKKSRKKRSKKSGLPPGTLVHIGDEQTFQTKITIIEYNEQEYTERVAKTIAECRHSEKPGVITWINVEGIHELNVIEAIGKHFDLHPLLLEDVVNTEQRPKLEDYGEYLFIVLRIIHLNENTKEIKSEQFSMVLGRDFLISFHEKETTLFTPIVERLRTGKTRIRKMGADYLAYSLMDAVVDHYFVLLEQVGELIENIEDEVVTEPTRETLQEINKLKREMLLVRKSIWPLREVINNFQHEEEPLVSRTTAVFVRDVYDHTIQVIETIESYRETIAGMLDIYLSSLSNRMNEIMKVLTIMATIFIPLTFIAGVYGMNFEYMPELKWRWGYFFIWGVMLAIALSMLIYFNRRKWL